MDTSNDQVKRSAAEEQFEDLMSIDLDFKPGPEAPVDDTFDLTTVDLGGGSPASGADDLSIDLAMEGAEEPLSLEEDISAPGGEEAKETEAEAIVDVSEDFIRRTEVDDDDAVAIKDFKAAVLAFEWEINDENMENFNREVSRFKKRWRNSKLLLIFMQILEALGKYIAVARARSNPDSIKLLLSVYNSLEKVVTSPRLTPRGKKKILMSEVDKYNQLKTKLTVGAKRGPAKGVDAKKPPAGGVAAMMAGHGAVCGDEIVVERAGEEDFPELDARLDDFFDDETLPPVDSKREKAPVVVPPHPEDDSCPAVDNLLDEMFSDVINKGREGVPVVEDEDVVTLDLGGEEEEEIVLGEESAVDVEVPAPPLLAEDESREIKLSGEIFLPDSLRSIFAELSDSDEISEVMAERLLAETMSLQQEWRDHPLLLTVLGFLVSLARETKAGNATFRGKSREITLTVFADLLKAAACGDHEMPSLVAETARKYLLWKEEVFPAAEFGGKEEQAVPAPAPVNAEKQEEAPTESLAEEKAKFAAFGEKEAESEQLFDQPEQEVYPAESPEVSSLWEKLKHIFGHK